jgi:hypothetical protein
VKHLLPTVGATVLEVGKGPHRAGATWTGSEWVSDQCRPTVRAKVSLVIWQGTTAGLAYARVNETNETLR